MEDLALYLEKTCNMDIDHPTVLDVMKRLDLTDLSPEQKAMKIFYFVRDKCHYNMYATTGNLEAYKASAILQSGEGWCLQKAVLFTALARAAGIPSRLIIVSIRNHKAPREVWDVMGTNVFFPHAYNHLYLNGRWIKAAATFDAAICKKINVPIVEFDGTEDAILPQYDNEGKPYIEYLEEFGYHADVPWPLIMEKSREMYGEYHDRWLGDNTSNK
ncbi:MAG: transglutaminase-like domain-containing protein [Bacillota bacterium]|nr:transglutaminase-like domain-containing protein [Bacillota bacterium]